MQAQITIREVVRLFYTGNLEKDSKFILDIGENVTRLHVWLHGEMVSGHATTTHEALKSKTIFKEIVNYCIEDVNGYITKFRAKNLVRGQKLIYKDGSREMKIATVIGRCRTYKRYKHDWLIPVRLGKQTLWIGRISHKNTRVKRNWTHNGLFKLKVKEINEESDNLRLETKQG